MCRKYYPLLLDEDADVAATERFAHKFGITLEMLQNKTMMRKGPNRGLHWIRQQVPADELDAEEKEYETQKIPTPQTAETMTNNIIADSEMDDWVDCITEMSFTRWKKHYTSMWAF